MKNKKLFLGVTASPLAIAGAVAAKTSHRSVSVAAYYWTIHLTCTICGFGSYTLTIHGGRAKCNGNKAQLLYTESNCQIPAFARPAN